MIICKQFQGKSCLKHGYVVVIVSVFSLERA